MKIFFFVAALFLFLSCGEKEPSIKSSFETPLKTYRYWIDAGLEGDLPKAMSSVSKPSRIMMEQQTKNRDIFVERMMASSAVFKNFSIVEKKITGDRAILVTEAPNKKIKLSTPFVKEQDGWKVDLVKMFGG